MRFSLPALFLAPLLLFGQSQKVTYSYDDAGRLAKVDYGNGQTVTYTYDKAGNLISSASSSPAAAAKSTKEKKNKPAKPVAGQQK